MSEMLTETSPTGRRRGPGEGLHAIMRRRRSAFGLTVVVVMRAAAVLEATLSCPGVRVQPATRRSATAGGACR